MKIDSDVMEWHQCGDSPPKLPWDLYYSPWGRKKQRGPEKGPLYWATRPSRAMLSCAILGTSRGPLGQFCAILPMFGGVGLTRRSGAVGLICPPPAVGTSRCRDPPNRGAGGASSS